MKSIIRYILIALGLFLLIQIIPYGRSHTNPPVIAEPAWDSPQTRALSVRACMDCHGNGTTWPWYSNFAPISWLVQRDVDEARQKLNFSTWGQGRQQTNRIDSLINNGEMPPFQFLIMHPDAALTNSEKQALIQGLQITLGK